MVKVKKNKCPILTKRINTLMISKSFDSDKLCFNVLADGFQLTECLTLGELLEFIVRMFAFCNHSEFYVSDYPSVKVNVNIGV